MSPPPKRVRANDDAPAEAPAARPPDEVLELDASGYEGASWVEAAAALFSTTHAANGYWPAAVHVHNVRFPEAVAALTHPAAWEALCARCGDAVAVSVHDLTAGQLLQLPLASWAALRRQRDAPRAPAAETSARATEDAFKDSEAPPPPPPVGLPAAQWARLCAGEHCLYLSALEMQTLAPEVASAFNSLAAAACLARFLPAAAGVEAHLGPILMAAEAGACSGWHRDGTRVVDAPYRAGDVNAFHAHMHGAKTWRLYAPRHTNTVARALRHAPANAFGNLDMTPGVAAALAAQGVHPVEIQSRAGDVVVLGKRVWHAVWTTQASISLASDRLLPDQLPELAAALPSFDGMPILPAKWAVREAAASLSAAVLHGTLPFSQRAATRDTLRGMAAFLEAQLAKEPEQPADARIYATQPPLCVSCERPHAQLRYCHGCGCELFNAFFECTDEDCPWEACAACCNHREGGACAHATLRPHLLHQAAADMRALLRRVKEAAERHDAA